MHPGTRAVRTIGLLIGVLAALVAASASAAEPRRWEVTVAIRVEGGTHEEVAVRLALPSVNAMHRVSGVELTSRGFQHEVTHQGDDAYVVFKGRVRSARRIAVTFETTSERPKMTFPEVTPVKIAPPELLPFLEAAPLFQSRSILVREFLETRVGPVVRGGKVPLLRAIFDATREAFSWERNGKSLPLDVIRRRSGKRIGIERAFTTFVRCARIPARFVEGMNLDSSTKQKRVFWTEVWANGQWWPVSASSGWFGDIPVGYLPLARDGSRVLKVDGPAAASYVVNARPVGGDA
jgi:hypothetical protein